jgi:predicted TIM-barrel fold metal-dependent hydrolase
MAALMEVARPGHVMYGSDWPYIDRHTIELQHECLATWKGFDDTTRAAVYRNSALDLFPRFR